MMQIVERGPVRSYSWHDMPRPRRRGVRCLEPSLATDIFTSGSLGTSGVITPIQWASFFPGAFQVVQTDLGLTYGGTPLAGGGATDTTALTGSLATVPVPILAKGTGAGVCNIYYDGVGTTPAMTGVTPSAGVPVALTGSASGLSLAWTSATIANGDTWTATCAGLADQSGHLKHYSQATASKQPVITVGINGKPGLLFVASRSTLLTSSLVLTTPAVAGWAYYLVGRLPNISTATNARILSGASGGALLCQNGASTNGLLMFDAGFGPNNLTAQPPIGSYAAIDGAFTNSASDFMRIGSTANVTGPNAGSATESGRQIGAGTSGATPSDFELLGLVYAPLGFAAAWRAAVNSAAGYGVGNVLV